jgi:hypothetical protein
LRLVLLLSPLFYVLLWNLVIRYNLTAILDLTFRLISSSASQEWAKVQVSAFPEVVVWRMRVIPIYWSEYGNLSAFHTLFSIAYLFYLATSLLQLGRIRNLNVPRRLSFLDLSFVKKFWLAFGAIAFLTTSLSEVAFLADLLALIYYVLYLVSLPMAPISLYIWWKKGGKKETAQAK